MLSKTAVHCEGTVDVYSNKFFFSFSVLNNMTIHKWSTLKIRRQVHIYYFELDIDHAICRKI